MTQQKQPTTEQEKAATPWRVRFTCGKAKPSYNDIRKDLLVATWGNSKMADLLFHFLVVASWEAHNTHLDASTKKVIVQETHAKIQTKVKSSEPTLVSHLKAFSSAGYVRKTAYRGAFEVDFEAIEKAFTEAPAKQSTSATSTDDLSFNLSLSQEVKDLRLEVQKLREQVEDLSLTLVSFKFQHAQSEHGFKFNLSLPLVSANFDEAATEANLAHIFKFAETKELYLNKSSGLALADGARAQKSSKNILDIRVIEDLDKERERENGASAPAHSDNDVPYLPDFNANQGQIHIAPDEQPTSEEKPDETEPAGDPGYEKPGEAEQDVLIERPAIPEMPLQSARWYAETAVLVSEALRGKYYTEKQRANQVSAARRMFRDFKAISRPQFEEIFTDWVKWWRDHDKGYFTLADLLARGQNREVRLQTALDRLEAREAKKAASSAPPKLTSSSLPSFSGMSDAEYYASLRGATQHARATYA